jgi:hypothetical protein
MDDPILHARVQECLVLFDQLENAKALEPRTYPDQKRIERLHDDLRDKCKSLALPAEYRAINSSALDAIHSDWKLARDESLNAARTIVEELRTRLISRPLASSATGFTDGPGVASGKPIADTSAEVAPTVHKRKRAGRRADLETIKSDAKVAADWTRARESGVYKPDFARQKGMTTARLDALLDRVAARKRRSDK